MSDVKVFAKVAGKDNTVAQYDWTIGLQQWEYQEPNPTAALQFVPATSDISKLPELTERQAMDVAENCFYSGAYMDVAAIVLLHLGADAMQTYCEFQSYEGMRDNSKVPESEFKWHHSGLTPIIINQYQGA